MKKIIYLFCLLLIIIFACKSKKSSTSAREMSDEQLFALAQSKYPDITQQEFQTGKSILNNQCKSCHGIKHIDSRSEQEWEKVLMYMAPKAKLSAPEKNALIRYLFSYRESKLMTK